MEIFSDSDDDSDSDSDEDQRSFPKFDYDARFRPLENLDLSAAKDPDPEAELCYILEDFGPENIKSWCLPDFVSADVFAIVKGGEPVDFIKEFNEFFWRKLLFFASLQALLLMTLNGPVVRVHRTSRAGVVPAFNIEGQFEREARHNKEANEKVRMLPSFLSKFIAGACFDSNHTREPPPNDRSKIEIPPTMQTSWLPCL